MALICPISSRCHSESFGRRARKRPAKPAKLMLIPTIAGINDRLLNGPPRAGPALATGKLSWSLWRGGRRNHSTRAYHAWPAWRLARGSAALVAGLGSFYDEC